MKDQNKKYYSEKCLELISQCESDSFCKAAANIMLSSGSEYLAHLVDDYKDKVANNEQNLFNENIRNVDENKAVKIIDNFVANMKQECFKEKASATPTDLKLVNMDSS